MPPKGTKQTEKTKRKISEAHKGMKKPWAGKYQHSQHSLEHSKNISKSLIGRKVSKETREKISNKLKGHFISSETKEKISLNRRGKLSGENHWNWKGGITPEKLRVRKSTAYRDWRNTVLKRDDYICVICGKRGGKLEVDHIKRFADYPELRLSLNNGRTLCIPCHKQTDTIGR